MGIATVFYLKPEPLTWVLLVAGCVGSTFLTYAMRQYLKFPTYTAPFILVTWLVLIVAHAMAGTTIDVMPASPAHTPSGFVDEVLAGAAEVMFGATVVTGILFLAGIALCTWRHAVLGLLGSIVGTLVALYHNDPTSAVHRDLWVQRRSGADRGIPVGESLLIAILAAMISVPLTEFFPSWLGSPLDCTLCGRVLDHYRRRSDRCSVPAGAGREVGLTSRGTRVREGRLVGCGRRVSYTTRSLLKRRVCHASDTSRDGEADDLPAGRHRPRRKAKGLKLNHPESMAVICAAALEGPARARPSRRS